jgi:GH15 family glucan-1,4-alpha-glucosidase
MCGDSHPDLFVAVLVQLGRNDEALEILHRMEQSSAPNPKSLLDAYISLGDIDNVLVWLERVRAM